MQWNSARLIGIALLTLTTSCGQGGSRPYVHVCPAVRTYTPAFQAQLLRERQAVCSEAPAMCEAIDDYGDLRDEARLCEAK